MLLHAPSSVQGLNVELSFTGSSLSTSGFIPPDTMGAVGRDHFLELISFLTVRFLKGTANLPW